MRITELLSELGLGDEVVGEIGKMKRGTGQ